MSRKIAVFFAVVALLSFVPFVFAQDAVQDAVVDEANPSVDSEETVAVSEKVSEQGEVKKVTAIEVNGNKTISSATILSKIKTRVGQDYLQSVVSDDLKRLYNTGYFADVKVDRENFESGMKVIFMLEEKPIIDEVTFSKTRYFNPKTLAQKIKTGKGRFLDKKSLKDDVDTIKSLYQAKGLTQVEVDTESLIDDVTNKASIHFTINEGYKVRIRDVVFEGNKSFRDKKLRKVLKTKTRKWYFFRSGYLKEDVLKEDVDRIQSFYEQNGYIDAKVSYEIEPTIKGRGGVRIKITIDEGRQYRVGSLTIIGNEVLTEADILNVIKDTKPGNPFSREKLSVDISNIRSLYFDRGYIFAQAVDATSLDPDSGDVQVKIEIKEGGVAYVNKVKIEGNARTKDVVIRRELKLLPGDRFDGVKLRRSKEKLTNLGYFEDVSFDIEDTDVEDQKDLVVQVKEAKTGNFSFGGGFSTVDKVVGFAEIAQRNFDLMNWPSFTGAGQSVLLRAETGSNRNTYMLSFTEPWLLGHPVSGGFDVYRSSRDRDEDSGYAYDEERTGGILRLGKQLSEYISGTAKYKREKVSIENFDGTVSAALAAEEGTNTVSVLGFDIAYDTRDNIYSPTKGWIISPSTDFAGTILGGDKDFYRLQLSGSYYIPFKWNSVVELHLHGGIVNAYGDSDTVPIFERFFAGGASSIRGYEERGVGPLDSNTLDPIGGEALMVGNIEYTIPLIEFIKFALFLDAGNVWADVDDFGSGDYKTGTGLGLRIKTPVGPVKLDYGYPLNDEPGKDDRSGKFYFSVSRGF